MSKFLATDRCDRCGAQAYVRTQHRTDHTTVDLLWCAHHAREHEYLLGGYIVDDERPNLTRLDHA